MSTVEEFVQAAGVLSLDDRMQLIDALWNTIPEDEWPQPTSEELVIVQERSREFDEGRVSATPWPEVRARLHTRIEQNHG